MNKELVSIIKFAIETEVESYEFYRDAALKVKDETLKETFENLAKEEVEHKEFLENFLKEDVASMEFGEIKDYKIAETIDKPKLSVEMEFSEALALAIKNEQEAMDMYNDLAEAAEDEKNRELFLGLADMEKIHKTKLEEVYVNASYGEVW